MENNICRCGHEEERHQAIEGSPICCMGCWFGTMRVNINVFDAEKHKNSLHNFTPDNLKYLENLYDSRTTGR